MNSYIIMVGCFIFGITVLIGFIFVTIKDMCADRKELKEIEKAEKAADITTEANKTKAGANTGDHERDFNYMADKLHDIANK